MKRLMIAAAAAVVVGLTASASQIKWGFGEDGEGVVDSTGKAFTGGTALLYVLTSSTAAPVFSEGAWNLNGAILVDKAGYDEVGGDMWGRSNWGYNSDAVVSGTTEGYAQQYFAVILTEKAGVTDLATYVGDDARYAMVYTQQGSQAVQDPSGPTYGTTVNNWKATVEMGDWKTASAVPEPTSGLLLLLGVAGLALKRRRS